jgi:hypothetical protein
MTFCAPTRGGRLGWPVDFTTSLVSAAATVVVVTFNLVMYPSILFGFLKKKNICFL